MSTSLLPEFVALRVEEGQKEYARIIRTLINHVRPDLINSLSSSDETVFLEPLLFAYFNTSQPTISLDQLIYGYLDDERRPRSIDVFADQNGVIYLPNIGYFETGLTSKSLQLVWSGRYQLRSDENKPIDFAFEPIQNIGDTSIELYRFKPPLFDYIFKDVDGNCIEIKVKDRPKTYDNAVLKALQLIKIAYPQYYRHIVEVTKRILIFSGQKPYSFASISAHGTAFLNVNEANDDEVFFLEDIAHQCGHIIFSAVTVRKEEFFRVDPETPLSQFTRSDEDHTSVYGAFHGLFTQSNINRCLLNCYYAKLFSGRQLHELLGRLSDDMKRFKSAVYVLARREVYTELGWALFHEFKRLFEELDRESCMLVNSFDTSNQPYLFNYVEFQKLNPLSRLPEILINAGYGTSPTETNELLSHGDAA